MRKSRVTVNYYIPGEMGKPLFKYLLTAEPDGRPGWFKVNIASLDPPGTMGALADGKSAIQADDLEIAFAGTLARMNSHHDKLKPQMSEIVRGDK